MNKNLILLAASLLFMSYSCSNKNIKNMPEAPKAEKIKKVLTEHNHERIDNYYWLNQRDNPKVIAYLEAENEYLNKVLDHTKSLQDTLYEEMIGRIKQTDMSVPYRYNGYYYYKRFEEGQEYPLYCRKKGNLEAQEEIMLNENELAEGHKFHAIGDIQVSPDNKIIAFGEDTVGRRKYTIRFKNLETGEFYTDNIPNTMGTAVWMNDNKTVFYTIKDETLRPYKVFRHALGFDNQKDKEIFHEADATYAIQCYRTKSGKYIMIASSSTLSDEFRFLSTDNPNGEFKTIQNRERGLEYSVSHYKEKFYIRTNLDAMNFRLMEAPVENSSKENWKEVIPHRKDVLLSGMELFKDHLVLYERKDALTKLRIIKWEDWSEHYVDFDEEVYYTYIYTNREFDTELLRFGYMSLTTPATYYDYNMNNKEKTMLKQQEVLEGFNRDDYQSERIWATAEDGTKVPISLLYKKGMERNGQNPLLLYAYGSYGSSTDPYFSSSRLSLVDRGFVFAIAHIRGGQEMGRQWYEDGKLLKKKNTFTDFNDCADYLIKQKYTSNEHMYAIGGSAGGLLMGAIVNMRPELYNGVIAAVPFVDVVTTMLDESIPLTTGEFDEWGNPKNKEYYDYMLSYSPYDNVEAKSYPNMLVTTGLHDSQVQYWEPAKWVAKLREMKTDDNLLLMYTNMDAGHGGASGRFQQFKETALNYAFLLDLEGIKK